MSVDGSFQHFDKGLIIPTPKTYLQWIFHVVNWSTNRERKDDFG